MSTTSTHIQLIPSTKPFYSEHSDLTRLQIELRPSTSTQSKSISPSLSALLFDQITSYGFSIGAHESSVMVISFGHLYLLKYPDQINSTTNSPQTLDSLQQHHFLPPLFDTFLPSTILERIEITASNAHCLQQIFFKSNHSIRREVDARLCSLSPHHFVSVRRTGLRNPPPGLSLVQNDFYQSST